MIASVPKSAPSALPAALNAMSANVRPSVIVAPVNYAAAAQVLATASTASRCDGALPRSDPPTVVGRLI